MGSEGNGIWGRQGGGGGAERAAPVRESGAAERSAPRGAAEGGALGCGEVAKEPSEVVGAGADGEGDRWGCDFF